MRFVQNSERVLQFREVCNYVMNDRIEENRKGGRISKALRTDFNGMAYERRGSNHLKTEQVVPTPRRAGYDDSNKHVQNTTLKILRYCQLNCYRLVNVIPVTTSDLSRQCCAYKIKQPVQ